MAMPHGGHEGQPAPAHDMKMDKPCTKMKGHDMGSMKRSPVKGVKNAESTAMAEANMTMHRDMDITYTGDADIDFLKGMIAHHQGAVDMAQIQLQYGRDPQVKRLAQEIIRAQNIEIKWMKGWLADLEAKGAKPSPDQPQRGKWNDMHWAGATWLNER
jgi:uncharacterized protein (DUF305 family)